MRVSAQSGSAWDLPQAVAAERWGQDDDYDPPDLRIVLSGLPELIELIENA